MATKLDGCGQFIKYSLFIVNFIVFIMGVIVCGLGIWTLTDKSKVQELIGTNLYIPAAAILVSLGGIVALISFLGCCGAIKEVKCLLGLFFVVMLLIAIIIALGAIFGFVVGNKINEDLANIMQQTMKEYNQSKIGQPLTDAWDESQQYFKCCGAASPHDWVTFNAGFKKEGPTVPKSCCEDASRDCTGSYGSGQFPQGCVDGVRDFVQKHIKPLAAVGITMAVIIVLSMIFSCALCLMV